MMSYIVMGCHPGYVILLDEEGRFYKAANLQYEVGQTVYDPILMKELPAKPKKSFNFWLKSGLAAAAACFLMFFGFSYYQNYLVAYSSIYLSINPEVQMDLNRQGNVIALTGTNEDGQALLEGYDGKGKDKVTVTDELIDRAIDMGFLSEGGQISFSIDAPDDVLFQEYGTELRTNVNKHLENRMTVVVEIVDHRSGQSDTTQIEVTPPASGTNGSAGDTDYGPNNDGVTDYNDTDYGPNNDGVTDYNDTDYGPNNDGVTDYNDTDYGSNSDGVTDYNNTDYGPNNDGVTDYSESEDDDSDSDDDNDDDNDD